MRDTRIEEQLRDVLRADADSIPLTLSAAELELRLRLRRSQRANQRMLLGAAAALAIAVGVGAAVLANNRNDQSVATSPSPSAPVVVPSTNATPYVEASPTAGPSVLLGFDQLLSEAALVEAAQKDHPGFVVAASSHWDAGSDTDPHEPGEITTSQVGTMPPTTEYILAGDCRGGGSFQISIGRVDVLARNAGGSSEPCNSTQSLVDPAGTFTSFTNRDIPGNTDVPLPVNVSVDARASWRVVVLVPESAMAPAPARHGPTVSCKSPGQDLPKITMTVNGGSPVTGEFGTTGWKGSYDDVPGDIIPSHVIDAKAGDALGILIGGDVCTDRWRVTYGLDVTKDGEPGQVEPVWYFSPPQENPDEKLSFASENRFSSIAREGDWIVHASLQFPDGDAQVYWHLIVEP